MITTHFINNLKLPVVAIIILLASAFVIKTDWKVKDDYSIKFKFGKYDFVKDSFPAPYYTVKGLKANISFDENNLEQSKIKASLEANTIDTGQPMKNASATGQDVLIADKFPLMTFESTSITKVNNMYEATGKLTIKDITKEIKIPFVFEKEIFNGSFTIETKDLNFTHPHVPKEITVFITLPVSR